MPELLYKCRKCGSIEPEPHTGYDSPHRTLDDIAWAINWCREKQYFEGSAFGYICRIHACPDGGEGISDIIGWKP